MTSNIYFSLWLHDPHFQAHVSFQGEVLGAGRVPRGAHHVLEPAQRLPHLGHLLRGRRLGFVHLEWTVEVSEEILRESYVSNYSRCYFV